MNELIKNVLQWGEEKGITGPNGKATLLTQLAKTQEELTETRDAAVMFNQHPPESFKGTSAWLEIADGIGDQVVTLILAAELAGTTLEECLALAYSEIKGRTGKMVDGTFVKDAK